MVWDKPAQDLSIATQDADPPPVLWRLLEHHARRTPDNAFLLSEAGTTTYAEAWATVRSIARGLLAQGVAPGDRVAMLTLTEEADRKSVV